MPAQFFTKFWKTFPPILWMVLLIMAPSALKAQTNDCANKIQEAQKLYDQGLIEEIPQMLAPCMETNFTRVQKIEAYKIIILSYLFDDNQFEAERTMVEFLKKFPEYEIMPNDPVEFVYLFESYRTTSVFSFGMSAGFNLTNPRIMEPYSVFDLKEAKLSDRTRTGFQVGVGVGNYLSRNMLLNVEFLFAENQYSFTDELRIPLAGGNDGINSVVYKEKLYKVELPVSLSYEFTGRKVHYFVRTGLSLASITGVTGVATREFSEEAQAVTGETQDMSIYRRKMLYSALLGTGIRYKVPRGVLTLDLRANFGMNNIVKPEKRYLNQQMITRSYYLDDDFSLTTFSLSAGYYFSFYKPKKQADK
jgi:hypothetical protein